MNQNQSLTDWFLDETAKRFGYQNGAEMVADQNARYQREQQNNQLLEQYKNQNTVSQSFLCSIPSIQTPIRPTMRSSRSSIKTAGNGHRTSMAAAHALAVQHRVYQPLSQQEIAVANGYAPRFTGPYPRRCREVVIRESGTPVQSEYEMPLDQLRKLALGAQTGGRR